MSTLTKSAQIRRRLAHPIIDSDGHTAEFEPALLDHLRELSGSEMVERFKRSPAGPFIWRWHQLTPEQRREQCVPRPLWWVHPTRNTLDRATSSLPRLLYERLDEMGLDFTVVYPSIGLPAVVHGDDNLRPAICRAINLLHARIFAEYSDRMTPVALIPMHTPQEALAELDFAVGQLKMKAIVMAAFVRRPIPAVARRDPSLGLQASWVDTLAMDSPYDYDPVWARCRELRVCPSFHSPSIGVGFRASTSNFVFNHIGHFAASADAICKALFMGGVTRRFPDLRFAFLEGGVAWAAALFNDLIGHWEKHGRHAVAAGDPANLNHALMRDLFAQYGQVYGDRRRAPEAERSGLLWGTPERPEDLDEFARCAITRREDLRDLFVPKFYFGCEGDDRLTPLAFDRGKIALGEQLNALYSSDLGHFDLPDMRDAASEAYELVEHGQMTDDDFRAFVFTNPVRFFTALNPDFFKGTRIEREAAAVR